MIPKFVLARAAEAIPSGLGVLPGSTPIVSFGNPGPARVATLSINPSHQEFWDAKLNPLAEPNRRFVDRAALGADEGGLSLGDAEKVVRGCFDYFTHPERVYTKWFDPMEKLVLPHFGASYYDGSACALDIVQWATNPVWRKLSAANRQELLDRDVRFLEQQLNDSRFDFVLLNGKSVIEQVMASGIAELEVVHEGAYPSGSKNTTFTVHTGTLANGTKLVGWSCYLQNMHASYADRSDVMRTAARVGR